MNDTHHDRLFDLSYLNQVFQGNEAMVDSIINLFLQQVPQYVKEMEQCVVEGQLQNLHPLAHKAKSSVAMLGLKKMEEKILLIEDTSKKAENLTDLPALVEEVRKECDLATSQLAEII